MEYFCPRQKTYYSKKSLNFPTYRDVHMNAQTKTLLNRIEQNTGKALTAYTRPDIPAWEEFSDVQLLMRGRYRGHYLLEAGELVGLNLKEWGLKDPDLDFLEQLPHLQSLNLGGNALTRLHLPARLQSLQYLRLNANPDLQTLSLGGALPSLEVLEANRCKLIRMDIPAGMQALRHIDLGRCKSLEEIHFAGDCPSLEWLDLGNNQLRELRLPEGFAQLQYLYLPYNQIVQLSIVPTLRNLIVLHLRNNKLSALPTNILDYSSLETLYLYGNEFKDIPIEVIGSDERGNSLESVKSYLLSVAEEKNTVFLHEAKMLLIGNGEVGKTSIRIKLLDKKAPLPDKNDRTPLLDIVKYSVKDLQPEKTGLEQNLDFQLNIWDFGGQGRYREIQQLFCSRKSLYIYVTSYDDTPEKDEYVGFEYWLSMVNAYSSEEEAISPVVHVTNKIDLGRVFTNEEARQKVFPNIHPTFVKISCETMENFEQLENTIKKVLPSISEDIFKNRYNKDWLAIKDALEARSKDNTITYSEYLQLCNEKKLSETDAKNWLNILDRIGALIYFGDHPDLRDWIVLNPVWIKDILCKLLDADILYNGILKPGMFSQIWPKYTDQDHKRFLALILKYKLAYEQRDEWGESEYIIPARLPMPKQKPPLLEIIEGMPLKMVKLQFKPFIPAGTVNKLMVLVQNRKHGLASFEAGVHERYKHSDALYVDITSKLQWKHNVVLHHMQENTYVHAEESWEEGAVYLRLYGANPERLYTYTLEALQEINKELKETKYIKELHIDALFWDGETWLTEELVNKYLPDFFQTLVQHTNGNSMKDIETLIAQDRLEKALEELLGKQLSNEAKADVFALQNRLTNLKRNERMDLETSETLKLEKRKIVNAMLGIIQQIKATESSIAENPIHEDRVIPDIPNPEKPPSIHLPLKGFICYARKEDSRLAELFVNRLEAHLPATWSLFKDNMILLGEDWNERLQQEVQRCNFAILLLSPPFFRSQYIREHEFENFLKREKNQNFPFFSVLMVDCNYSQ